MRKRKYIIPRSNSMQLRTQQMLATSVPVTNNENVDESDKSMNRIWSSETFYSEKISNIN
ncbi:MAG: hypothetical protein PUI06_02105 [Prevotella sp.]|nr:hypothetical protein [Prevotella sp.]